MSDEQTKTWRVVELIQEARRELRHQQEATRKFVTLADQHTEKTRLMLRRAGDTDPDGVDDEFKDESTLKAMVELSQDVRDG